jgi:SAM-dependent methyltransferase
MHEVTVHPIEWDSDKVARLWNHYAGLPHVQGIFFAKVWGGRILRRAALPRAKALRIVDFGCGPGYLFDHVRDASPTWRYTGLDFSQASVELLRTRLSGRAQFDDAIHATALPTPLPASQFDVVTLIEVVEHLTDDQLTGALAEARRLLRPDGRLVITTPNQEDLALSTKLCPECGALFHEWQHVRAWAPDGLARAVSGQGFNAVRRWVGHWDDESPIGWLTNRLAARYLGRRHDPHMMMVFEPSDGARSGA